MTVIEHKPKYIQIAEAIKNQDLAKGCYLPSELSYTVKFKVSRLTIRRALSYLEQRKLVSPVKAKRRQTLKNFARRPAATTFACIGYGAAGSGLFANPFHLHTFEHLACEFQRKGISLLPVVIDPSRPELPDIVNSRPIGAYILMGGDLPFADQLDHPLVAVDDHYRSTLANAVCQDGKAIGQDAVRYLYAKGHRAIACLDYASEILYPFSDDLRAGYLRELQLCDPALRPVCLEVPLAVRQNGAELEKYLKAMLKTHPQLDAALIFSTNLAIKTVNSLGKLGIAVPGRISIVAVGGSEDPALCEPALTCYENDYPRFARCACEYILNIVAGRQTVPGKLQVKAYNLAERQSVKSGK